MKKIGTEKMKAWYSFSSVEAKEEDEEEEEGGFEQQLGGCDLKRDITS